MARSIAALVLTLAVVATLYECLDNYKHGSIILPKGADNEARTRKDGG